MSVEIKDLNDLTGAAAVPTRRSSPPAEKSRTCIGGQLPSQGAGYQNSAMGQGDSGLRRQMGARAQSRSAPLQDGGDRLNLVARIDRQSGAERPARVEAALAGKDLS